MEYYLVSPQRIVHERDGYLTYESGTSFEPGHIVRVEVGKKIVAAVVIRKVEKPSYKTKEIIDQIETTPIPQSLIALHTWMCTYYTTHPVTVWQTMLPSGLMKKRRLNTRTTVPPKRDRTQIVFNEDQAHAVSTVWKYPEGTTLIHGVTGSGKTAIYRELAKRTVAEGRSVIILVPEIALTSQLVAEFLPDFPDLILTHSTMTEANRHTAWKTVLESQVPTLVIGPRSALFMPVPNLGLVVIDECHESAFKQEKAPRYSALRAASILTKAAHARLVMGSATPSVQDYYLATKTEPNRIVTLEKPARQNTVKPTLTLVDMTKKAHFRRSRFLSEDMLAGIEKTLAASHQVLMFHNRRGNASVSLCENCGWTALCPRCFVPLTLHADSFELRCHICDHREKVPTSCPECHHAGVIHKGIGTKRVAEELARLFPSTKIRRFDGDSDVNDGVDSHYQALYDGGIDIIIGTQVVAKGLDLPKLRFVGVVQADSGLSLPDYLSTERVFQLLAQVSGRVGRNEHASEVVIQSYQPTHPSVQFGMNQDYASFYDYCLDERRHALFPPFCYLLKLTVSYKTESYAVNATRQFGGKLKAQYGSKITVLGPTPAFYERVRDGYRWQLIVKSSERSMLARIADGLPSPHWQAELDPASIL